MLGYAHTLGHTQRARAILTEAKQMGSLTDLRLEGLKFVLGKMRDIGRD